MNMVMYLGIFGGLFAVFTFVHFFVDWVFQSHAEAMVKHNNAKVRAKHCAIYTAGFLPLLIAFLAGGYLAIWQLLLSVVILFVSHFVEDTYLPVYLWAKYIRRPPEMTEPIKSTGPDGYITLLPPDPKAGFVQFVQTSLGKILMIAIDQIIHLAFLFPVVWMVMSHLQ